MALHGLIVSISLPFFPTHPSHCSIGDLFGPAPLHLLSHSEVRKRPNCSHVADLPHSMLTMDHLEPIMYRANFRRIPQLGERNLRKVRRTLREVCGLS